MLHLTFLEIVALIGYRAWRQAPRWGMQVVELAEAIRRFRHGQTRARDKAERYEHGKFDTREQ
jgi:hypothetical protein